MKGYYTLKYPELDLCYQMQFNVKPRTPLWGGFFIFLQVMQLVYFNPLKFGLNQNESLTKSTTSYS